MDGNWLSCSNRKNNIPLNVLEGSFLRFSGGQAYVAYAESLAAVTYINDSYGMGDIQRILQLLSQWQLHRGRTARHHPLGLRPT